MTRNNIIDPGYGIEESVDSNYVNNKLSGITWNVNDNSGIFLDYMAANNIIDKNTISSSTSGCAHAIFANSARGDSTVSGNIYTKNSISGDYSGPAVQY